MTGSRRLLVIFAGDLASARAKGVEQLLLQYDEEGFFDSVVMISPYLRRDAQIALDPRHELRQFGFGGPRWMQRLLAPFHVARLVLQGRRIVRDTGVSLIRATEPTLCGLIAWAVARLTCVPYVLSLHADYDKRYALDRRAGAPTILGSRRLVRLIERLTLRGAARVLPIRESLVGYALARGAASASIRVIPHGIEFGTVQRTAAAGIRPAYGIPPGKAIVSFAGRLSPENYLRDALDAIAVLARRRDDFVFVIAGGGVLEREVKARLAADETLARVVRLVGFVPRERVIALRSESRVSLCLMGGYSLIEACGAGSAVVAYDVEWHAELVIDGQTGALVREGNVAGVATSIESFLEDPEKAARCGAAARALAVARHSREHTAAIKRQVYRELLDGTLPAR